MPGKPPNFADEVALPDAVESEEDCTPEVIGRLLGIATDLYDTEFRDSGIPDRVLEGLIDTMREVSAVALYNSLRAMMFDDMFAAAPQTVFERKNKLVARMSTIRALIEKQSGGDSE